MVQSGKDIYGTFFEPPINTHVSHAFYLNCRKLSDFFQNKPGPDDVLAEHFVPGYQAGLNKNDSWRVPINKQLAHVTYFRDVHAREITREVSKELYVELKDAWRKFRSLLPEPYKSEFVKKVKERKEPYSDDQLSEFRFYDLD
jgi:DNA-dependent RNA polymerase auxiliary subunit epsilon